MKDRRLVLAACVIVLTAVVLLAPALQELRFEPARSVGRSQDAAKILVLSDLRIGPETSIWEILLVWLASVAPLVLAVLLLPPALRKKVLQHILRFALFILTLVLALRYRLIHLPNIGLEPGAEIARGSLIPPAPAEVETFSADAIPPWLAYAISVALVWFAGLALYIVYRAWKAHSSRRHGSLDPIADIARSSLDDLATGRQWGDVVVEAYARMIDAVRLSRGLARDPSATAREFAARLARTGLPASSIDELTHLFEAARYGSRVANDKAKTRAVACLQTILQACRAGS